MRKILSILLGLTLSLNCLCFSTNAVNAGDNQYMKILPLYDNGEKVEINLTEGETVQLDFQPDSELYDLEDVQYYSYNRCAIVSSTGKLVGCKSGEDKVIVSVRNKNDNVMSGYELAVNVLYNDEISEENRSRLDRLNEFKYVNYRRKKMELLGAVDEDTPRLTMEKLQEFIDSSENRDEIFKKINNYVVYPDAVSNIGNETYCYWLDDKGNEVISLIRKQNFIAYTKIADDGTVIGVQELYPEKSEFVENGVDIDHEYIEYNEIVRETVNDEGMREIIVCEDDDENPEIQLFEGETVQLVMPVEPDMPEINYISFSPSTMKDGAVVTQDLKLTGLSAGVEHISIYIGYEGIEYQDVIDVTVNIRRNNSISEETRKELERLEKLDGYYRRRMELLGAIDEDAPRLTMEKVQEIIDSADSYLDILYKLNEYHILPDQKPSGGGMTNYFYWFDDKGNESIQWCLEEELVFYTKTNNKGYVEAGQYLYPEKSEILESDEDWLNYEYTQFNQVKPEGFGTLSLKFVDYSTNTPFTETNGTFVLTAKPIEGEGEEKEIKSWKITENSVIVFEELSKDYLYTLVYNDEYHTDENGRFYKYEIAGDYQKETFDFNFNDKVITSVYLKKHYSDNPQKVTMGDVNRDGKLTIADIAVFEKWLLGGSFYGGEIVLENPWVLDFCDDDKLDVFDLCLMKEAFLKGGENAELPTLEEISLMTEEEATEIFSEYTFQEIECIWGEFDYYHSGLYGGGWEIGGKSIGLSFDYYTQKLDREVVIQPLPT